MINKKELDKCPRQYIKWVFVAAGMVFGFLAYLLYSNIAGSNDYFVDSPNIILTEHINEEDEYEKPVCKRLEESGERYSQQEIVIDGEI